MRHLLAFLLLALSLGVAWPAEIRIVAVNDAGTTVATEVIKTDNAKLATLEVWRLKQLLEDRVTLQFPTRGSMLRYLLIWAIQQQVLSEEPTAEMKTARDAQAAAKADEKTQAQAAFQ